MNLNVKLSPEIEARLRQQVIQTGKSPEDLVLEALRDKLCGEPVSTPSLTSEEWLRQFDEWVTSHSTRNPQLDDSRGSIYPDRW